MSDAEKWDLFMEIHSGNPQEGPGDFESTAKAFSMLNPLPPNPRILDVGCGPGRQTLDLCRLSDGQITAVDLHQPYLDQIQKVAPTGRIKTLAADMGDLPFGPKSFDLIWSEGAIYNIGFFQGLEKWFPMLGEAEPPPDFSPKLGSKRGAWGNTKEGSVNNKPTGATGQVAVTELSWLKPDPAKEALAFWNEGYPQMQTVDQNLADMERAGYEPLGHFTLPESAWWNYYHPLAERIAQLEEKYSGNSNAQELFAAERAEQALYRNCSDSYGDGFYIGQKT